MPAGLSADRCRDRQGHRVTDRADGGGRREQLRERQRANGRSVEGVVADGGPSNHLGEISVACAKAIGVPIGSRHPANGGGASSPTIVYHLYPGTPAVVNGVTYPLQGS